MLFMQEPRHYATLYENNEIVKFGSRSMSEYIHTKYSFTKQENVTSFYGYNYNLLTNMNRLTEYYHWSDAIDDNTRREFCWYIPNALAYRDFNNYVSSLHGVEWVTPPEPSTNTFSLSTEQEFESWLYDTPFAELEITTLGEYLYARMES